MSATPVTLLRGAEAHAAMRNADLLAHWRTLLERCPYATAFQHPEFVCPWYSTYRDGWEPIVLLARDASDDLSGLWSLAWNEERRALVHAGAHHAEYQTWLASEGREAAFLESAWTALRHALPCTRLGFTYLPNAGLADLLQTTLGTVTVRRRSRPLMRLDPESIRASLAKKKNRYRFNRLARLGPVEFRRVVDLDEFQRVFDELIDFYDFRHGATHHVMPFRSDPLKRQFHETLFTTAPARVLLTVTYLGGRPIAGCWCLAGGGRAHVIMPFHSPFLAEHSPGILHFMQLSEYLAQNGTALIDLTPGDHDAWKQRFANEQDEVASAVLHASRWRAESHARAARSAKRMLKIARLTPRQALSGLTRLQRATPSRILRGIRKWIWESREVRIYSADRSLALQQLEDPRVRCNGLADLMLFQPTRSSPTREAFLSAALARLEQGESVWTLRSDGCLAHCGWMSAGGESRLMAVDQTLTMPPGRVLLDGFYSAPAFRSQGLQGAALGHMLRAAFADESRQQAYLSVSADDGPWRHLIEAMGLRYRGSFHWRRRLGRVRKWADPVFCPPEDPLSEAAQPPAS